tara:strand:+ start:202 stop:324 length:123 start_codon:yes stop_codon:yes gene_type:complete
MSTAARHNATGTNTDVKARFYYLRLISFKSTSDDYLAVNE